MTTVMIKSEKCLNCKHLFDKAKNKYKCYTSDCPAKSYQIRVGLNINKVGEKLAKAHIENNTVELARMYEKLANYDIDIVNKVIDYSKLLITKHSK